MNSSDKPNEEANVGEHITVDGIVAQRDFQPYLRIFVNGNQVAQISIAQARKIAADIVQMASRCEADAMIHRFFNKQGLPPQASRALMLEFRKFRQALDEETVAGTLLDPETGERV
jgi:hypothetical protein